jgi:type IV pilus assembly protein PilW
MRTAHNPMIAPRRSMQGISMVELMIAMVLGLIVMAALASIFANSSAARAEMERSSRQIENGRFAMELLADDLRMAGFYGELNVRGLNATTALQDPCSFDPFVWARAISVGIQGYDNGTGAPPCMPAGMKPNTDILVVRRAGTCEAGAAGCDAAADGLPYVQVSKCSPENVGGPGTSTPYKIGIRGGAVVGQQIAAGILSLPNFDLNVRSCASPAGIRRYYVRIYFISTDNGNGLAVPTLKRLDLTGNAFTETPLVEGIEELNIEYGIDTDADGNPDFYNTDPTTFTNSGACTTCNPYNNWSSVVTARVSLLARNIESSPGYTDTKTYTVGRNAAGADVTVTPADAFRRHAYSGLVRVVNIAQRRETPP